MTSPIRHLIDLASRYCAATGKTRIAVSKRVFNDGKVIDNLADGKDITVGRYERAMRWFSENWPEGAEWPSHVERPHALGDVA